MYKLQKEKLINIIDLIKDCLKDNGSRNESENDTNLNYNFE